MPRIGTEGKVGNDQHPAAHIEQRTVELTVFILKNPQIGRLFRKEVGLINPILS